MAEKTSDPEPVYMDKGKGELELCKGLTSWERSMMGWATEYNSLADKIMGALSIHRFDIEEMFLGMKELSES